MFKFSKSNSKVPLLLIFALLIGSVLWLYVNRYLTQSKAAQPKVNVTMVPETASYQVGKEYSVFVFIQPADTGLKLSGIDLVLMTQGNTQIVDVKTPTSLAGNDQSLFTQVARTISQTSSRTSYSIIRPENELPTAAKIEVVLKGSAVGEGSLIVDTTKTKIVGKIAGYIFELVANVPGKYTYTTATITPSVTGSVTGSPSATPAISCAVVQDCPAPPANCQYVGGTQCSCGDLVCETGTVTPTPSSKPSATPIITKTVTPSATPAPGNAKVSMKLKLQGVVRKPNTANPITVKVTLVNQDTFAETSQNISFSVDDQGMWSGNGSFNAAAGAHYYALIKGPKHLQKKVCVTSPTETAPGTYRCANGQIALKNGDNTFDFSNIYLLVGDLPDQDGVVDSYDISFIRNNLGSTDAKTQLIGDLNYDGRVDSQDYSLVIASLSIKKDEE